MILERPWGKWAGTALYVALGLVIGTFVFWSVVLEGASLDFAGQRLQAAPDAEGGSSLRELVAQRARQGWVEEEYRQSRVAGRMTAERPLLLLFSIPFDRGWRARVDGQPTEIHRASLGLTGVPLEPGNHRIELAYTRRFLTLGGGPESIVLRALLRPAAATRDRLASLIVVWCALGELCPRKGVFAPTSLPTHIKPRWM